MIIQRTKSQWSGAESNLVGTPCQVPHLEVSLREALIEHGFKIVIILQSLSEGISNKDDIAVFGGIEFSNRLSIVAGHCQRNSQCAEKQDDVSCQFFIHTVTCQHFLFLPAWILI